MLHFSKAWMKMSCLKSISTILWEICNCTNILLTITSLPQKKKIFGAAGDDRSPPTSRPCPPPSPSSMVDHPPVPYLRRPPPPHSSSFIILWKVKHIDMTVHVLWKCVIYTERQKNILSLLQSDHSLLILDLPFKMIHIWTQIEVNLSWYLEWECFTYQKTDEVYFKDPRGLYNAMKLLEVNDSKITSRNGACISSSWRVRRSPPTIKTRTAFTQPRHWNTMNSYWMSLNRPCPSCIARWAVICDFRR